MSLKSSVSRSNWEKAVLSEELTDEKKCDVFERILEHHVDYIGYNLLRCDSVELLLEYFRLLASQIWINRRSRIPERNVDAVGTTQPTFDTAWRESPRANAARCVTTSSTRSPRRTARIDNVLFLVAARRDGSRRFVLPPAVTILRIPRTTPTSRTAGAAWRKGY